MNLPALQERCVIIRGGIEFWVSQESATKLERALKSPTLPRFIEIKGQHVNTYEIVGIFTPEAMEEKRRRANGQWTCKWGKWHEKSQVCEHEAPKPQPIIEVNEQTGKAEIVGYTEPK